MPMTTTTTLTAVCDECGHQQDWQAREAQECFERAANDGWRLSQGAVLCPVCAKDEER